jgi:uncharacterized protein (TIGR02594 family)
VNILIEALKDFGIAETVGPGSSADIMAMAKEVGAAYPTDETPWCGLAMAAWANRAGVTPPKGSLRARSWLTFGTAVLGSPELGDVCVLWRGKPDSTQGHVGLFIARRGGTIYLLGGNQGNQVSIQAFPVDRLLGTRRAPPPLRKGAKK